MSEAKFKAFDKRISGLERKADAQEKAIRQIDLTKFLKRLDTIEKRQEKIIIQLATVLKNPSKLLSDAGGLSETAVVAIVQQEGVRARKDAEKMMTKIMADTKLDVRLMRLEGLVQTALAK